MTLHYTVRALVDDEELRVIHAADIFDATDELVDLAEALSTDERIAKATRMMINSHAAGLIRQCYAQVINPGEEHYIMIRHRVGVPIVRLVVRREADILTSTPA